MSLENIIYQNKIPKQRSKLAIFDVDGTIIKPKDGRQFPKNKNDWQWLRKSVPETIKQYYQKKYMIIFLTDQTKLWKVDMIKEVIKCLDIPIICLIAMDKQFHKPNPIFFLEHFNEKYNKDKSFYVGDAAGRKNDWSDRDKEVAFKLGVKFYVPEDIFPLEIIQNNDYINFFHDREVIIMIGYPGSGKSTLVKNIFEPKGYIRIDGASLKTSSKMIKEASKYIKDNSIVFDATNGTKEKRAQFINFANKYNVPVRCIWKTTSIDISMEQNKERENKVPNIAFYTYRKIFEEPSIDEFTILSSKILEQKQNLFSNAIIKVD